MRFTLLMCFLTLARVACAALPATDSNLSVTAGPDAVLNRIYPPMVIQDQGITLTTLADRMAMLHAPGISVAVIHGGKLAWARGFGVVRQGGAAVTTDTLFQAASVSKMLTAMAVLTLVEQGKLDLDVDVNRYLTSWKLPDNDFTKQTKVTLRMLLTHTGGISSGVEFYPRNTKVLPTLIQILRGTGPAANGYKITVDHTPGKTWSYANGGYDIIEQLLEDVTGRPFDQFMRDTVLKPLGMVRSSYVEPLPNSRLSEAATPYDAAGTPVPAGPKSIPEEAAGGLWTTPSELSLAIQDLLQSLAGKPGHLLTPEMARKMVTPGLGDWGLGCAVGKFKGGFHFGHDGDTAGFHTTLLAFNSGEGYVLMTNGDGGDVVMDDVRRTLAEAYGWPEFQPRVLAHAVAVDPAILRRYVGHYEFAAFHIPFALKLVGGQLELVSDALGVGKALALDNQTFLGAESGTELHFVVDQDGEVLGADSTLPNGMHLKLDRIPPPYYRHADPGVSVPPKRIFLDLSKDGPLGGVWCGDATMTARIRSGQIEYEFDSGSQWGCADSFPSNVGPFVQSKYVDLRGYDAIQFRAKAPDKLQFQVHLTEAGSASANSQEFKGVNGTDGESYGYPSVTGTGQWKTYTIDLADGLPRLDWGNQHGNHVLDLQAISGFDFVILGKQGKGELLVKDLEFRSYPR